MNPYTLPVQVHMSARYEYEFVGNYKLLKRSLETLNMVKVIPQLLSPFVVPFPPTGLSSQRR